MRSRAVFFVAMALCALVANAFPPALAQQPRKVFRIGILSPAASPSTKLFNAFREGLHDRGYVDGRNITIEYRLAAGDINRLPAMANELIRLPVDIIVADGSKSAQIAHEATQTIPIMCNPRTRFIVCRRRSEGAILCCNYRESEECRSKLAGRAS